MMEGLFLFADVKYFIGLVHFVLREPEDIKFIVESFTVNNGCLCLPYCQKDQNSKILHVTFKEYALTSLCEVKRLLNNEISLRIIITEKSENELNFSVKTILTPKNILSEMQKVLLSGEFECNCGFCSETFINVDHSTTFFYSESNEAVEAAEMSWCLCGCVNIHMEPNHLNKLNEDESYKCCFISEKSVTFKNYFCDDNHCKLAISKDTVKCKMCETKLGTFTEKSRSTFIKVLLNLISVSDKKSLTLQLWPESPKEFELVFSQWLLFKKNLIDCNKFLIETRNDENHLESALLISLLEDDATMCFESWKDNVDNDVQSIDLYGLKCIRLMVNFCETDEDKKLTLKWLCDFSVENVELPPWKVIILKQIIKNNSNLLPLSLKVEMNFEISFLRR